MMRILVTGTAGFIGSTLAMRLLERGDEVIGIDNMSDYYNVTLKQARLTRFADTPRYTHIHVDIVGALNRYNAHIDIREPRVICNGANSPHTSPLIAAASEYEAEGDYGIQIR